MTDENERISDQYDEGFDDDDEPQFRVRRPSVYAKPLDKLDGANLNKVRGAHEHSAAIARGRWRCLTTGCNPPLDEETAAAHRDETGHRVAKWPVRSLEGSRRQIARNRSGYYDKYNVGAKSAQARGIQ